jgi:hypothetical protein
MYELADLDAAQRGTVVGWFHGAPILDGQLALRHDDVISVLTTLGAVNYQRRSGSVDVRWIGDVDQATKEAFVRILTDMGVSVVYAETAGTNPDQAALLVIVKSNASMYDCARITDTLVTEQRTHLFCDVGFHHTITIGPTVVPGQSACVRCLAERIGGRWGDLTPPPEPHATHDGVRVVATLLARSLRPSPSGSLPFLNEVVTLDLDLLTTTRQRVFRNPWCSACAPVR